MSHPQLAVGIGGPDHDAASDQGTGPCRRGADAGERAVH